MAPVKAPEEAAAGTCGQRTPSGRGWPGVRQQLAFPEVLPKTDHSRAAVLNGEAGHFAPPPRPRDLWHYPEIFLVVTK